MRLSPSSGGVAPCGVAREVFEEVEPAGLEFVTDESQPEHPASEGVFFIVRFGLPCRGLFLCEGLMDNRQAELDVSLDFAGV